MGARGVLPNLQQMWGELFLLQMDHCFSSNSVPVMGSAGHGGFTWD